MNLRGNIKALCFFGYFFGLISILLVTTNFSLKNYTIEKALCLDFIVPEYKFSDEVLASNLSKHYYEFQKKIAKESLDMSKWSNITSNWILNNLKDSMWIIESKRIPFTEDGNSLYWILQLKFTSHRSTGLESILLTATYPKVKIEKYVRNQIYGFALAISFMNSLTQKRYMSKDVILILTPDEDQIGVSGILQWLKNHHDLEAAKSQIELVKNYSIKNLHLSKVSEREDKLQLEEASEVIEEVKNIIQYKHGVIYICINLDLYPASRIYKFYTQVDGENGFLSNSDLLYAVKSFSKIPLSNFLNKYQDLKWSENNSNFFSWTIFFDYKRIIRSLFELPKMIFGSKIQENKLYNDYINNLEEAFSFAWTMARNTPTGRHFYMKKYKIDSITIKTIAEDYGNTSNANYHHYTELGKILEATLRSIHSAIVPLYRGFYNYLPLGSDNVLTIVHHIVIISLLFAGPLALIVHSIILKKSNLCYFVSIVIFSNILIIFPIFCIAQSHLDLNTTIVCLGITQIATGAILILLINFVFKKLNQETGNSMQDHAPHEIITSNLNSEFHYISLMPILIFIASMHILNYSFCLLISIVFSPFISLLLILENTKKSLLFKFVINFCLSTIPFSAIILMDLYFSSNTSASIYPVNLFKYLVKFILKNPYSPLSYFIFYIYIPLNTIQMLDSLIYF